jgi:hypothetical protein
MDSVRSAPALFSATTMVWWLYWRRGSKLLVLPEKNAATPKNE